MDRQKTHFENLDNIIHSPIYTSKNWRDGNNYNPGKQHILGTQLPPIDHRSVGSNEIVIDLDARSFSLNAKYGKMISGYLNSQEIPHYCYWSGNKGLHIHIYLDNPNIPSKEGQDIVKEAIKHGCNIWRDIRLELVYEFVEQAGINKDLVGIGKTVDLAKISWDEMGRAPLIRCCGGANKKIDIIGDVQTAYKMFLPTLPDKKPKPLKGKPWCFEEVLYPKELESMKVDGALVVKIAHDYLQELKSPKTKKELKDINFTGKYMSLPCIRTLMEGLETGGRSFGAQQIATAMRQDGHSKEETYASVRHYAESCPQVPDTFEFEEAKQWVDWVFNLPEPYFACGLCKRLKVCESHLCSYHKEKYEEEIALFEDDEPLKKIKKVLDQLVVGEDTLKMQLFLVYLTKQFDPEWCVIIDGAASSGKSHTMKAVASLFGIEDEDYFVYSRLTGAVLNRIQEEAEKWRDSIVIIEEFQGTKAALEQLRVLISERKLKLLETVEVKSKDGTKKLGTKTTTITLKNTLFVTCQAEDEDEGGQMKSRSWILNTDQSIKQTKDITEFYLNRMGNCGVNECEEDIDKIRAGLSVLVSPDRVVFPFASQLFGMLPTSNVRARRDIKKLIALVKASAYFHQKNRNWCTNTKGEYILLADWRDIKIVMDIAWNTMMATTQGMGERDMKFYNDIIGKAIYLPEFSIDDVIRWVKMNKSTAKRLMVTLCSEGYIENTTIPPQKAIYKVTDAAPVMENIADEIKFKDLIEKQMDEIKKFCKSQNLELKEES